MILNYLQDFRELERMLSVYVEAPLRPVGTLYLLVQTKLGTIVADVIMYAVDMIMSIVVSNVVDVN